METEGDTDMIIRFFEEKHPPKGLQTAPLAASKIAESGPTDWHFGIRYLIIWWPENKKKVSYEFENKSLKNQIQKDLSNKNITSHKTKKQLINHKLKSNFSKKNFFNFLKKWSSI